MKQRMNIHRYPWRYSFVNVHMRKDLTIKVAFRFPRIKAKKSMELKRGGGSRAEASFLRLFLRYSFTIFIKTRKTYSRID